MHIDRSMFLLRVTEGRISLGAEAGRDGPADLEPSIYLSAVVDNTWILGTDGKDYSALPWNIQIDGTGTPHALVAQEPSPGIGCICYSSSVQSGPYFKPETLLLTVRVGEKTIRDLVSLIGRGLMPAFLRVIAEGAEYEATPEGPRNRWDMVDGSLAVMEFNVAATVAFAPRELPTEPTPCPL